MLNHRAAVAQWLRLELSFEVPGSIPTIYEFSVWKEYGAHHTNVLALCWCLVSLLYKNHNEPALGQNTKQQLYSI